MSHRTSLRALFGLAAIGTAIFAVHCSSSDSGTPAASCSDADPTSIRQLTVDQKTLVTQTADHAKAALSPAEWRYLFKLRYAKLSRAVVETDPVVVKALATIAKDTSSCSTGATAHPASFDPCERFVNVDKCWNDSPFAAATVPCFVWSMMVAGSDACAVPSAPSTNHVDAQAWDDSQDGRETADCEAPCFAGGGCSAGACRCAADEAACVGGCGRTTSDVLNCGACGVACAAGTACVEGVCGGTPDAG